MSHQLDLVILVADADAEWGLRTLLEERHSDLGIRNISLKIVREPVRDAGVMSRAEAILRPFLRSACHAIAICDREGCGREQKTAADLEADMEVLLRRNGWLDTRGNSRAAAIVLDPELEIWVWSGLHHVAKVLSLSEHELCDVLRAYPTLPSGKPVRPKEAWEAALRRAHRPASASLFRELAARVRRASLFSEERAFAKLRSTLIEWFPKEQGW